MGQKGGTPPILILWGLLQVYNFSDNKVFVSYHSHFRVEWEFSFQGLSRLLDFRKVFFFFCLEPIGKFIT
jgi:hypothetical protein